MNLSVKRARWAARSGLAAYAMAALLESGLPPADGGQHQLLGKVRASARRMWALLDDRLDLSRDARQVVTRSPVDMDPKVRSIVAEAGPEAARVRFEIGGLPPGHGDLALLRQVWGIGLVIVKRVVQWHGGQVWARSQPGRGHGFLSPWLRDAALFAIQWRFMELRQLRQFAAVAEHLSFRRAAEHLHMAQPPLSIAIAKLESELGVQLFDRRSRRVSLTPAGEAALPAALKCLALAREFAAAAHGGEHGESGVLRIGFVGSATYSLLPKLMPAFRQRYPAVEVELRESINMDILARLEAHDLDIGLVRLPTYQPKSLDFEVREVDVFKAVLPAGHALARRRKLTLEMLAQEPLISYAASRVPGLTHMVIKAFQHVGVSPRVTQEAYQVQTIISLVESGLGVALVPGVSQRHASDQVVFRTIADLTPDAEIGLAVAYAPANTRPTIARFREIAAEVAPLARAAQAGGLQAWTKARKA